MGFLEEGDCRYDIVHTPLLDYFSAVINGQELYYSFRIFEMLSIDYLSGGIPEEIASLDALINLNLSRSHLIISGGVPDKIGAMKSLESLDLLKQRVFLRNPFQFIKVCHI